MTTPALPGGTVEVDGLRLHVERRGVGPRLILLHGLADDHRLWRRVVPTLAERFETIAVDLPGHGRSDPVPDGASIEWFAGRIGRLIERLGAEHGAPRPVLAGLSMGGGIAQYVALADPGRLRGLILVSTSPAFPAATRERFRSRAARAEADGMAAVVDATVPRWFTHGFAAAHPAEVEATRATVLAMDPVSFARASRANAARDCTDRLRELDLPVLFVAGTDDPADPTRALALYRERVPHLRTELLDGVSHLLPVEAPERLLPVLLEFLDDLPKE